jgi:hypothetical protein
MVIEMVVEEEEELLDETLEELLELEVLEALLEELLEALPEDDDVAEDEVAEDEAEEVSELAEETPLLVDEEARLSQPAKQRRLAARTKTSPLRFFMMTFPSLTKYGNLYNQGARP